MPLKRLKEEYLEQDGVRFLREDAAGSTVACRVSHEALRGHADRMRFSGTDGAVFEARAYWTLVLRAKKRNVKDLTGVIMRI